jgi:Phosphate transport regulator (distant homolog of PhoU)
MRIQDLILPEDRVFFQYFTRMTATLREAAGHLADMTSDLSSAHQKCHAIRQLEHEADGTTREIYERLDESLITPLEPEEIGRLAPALDDVIDSIDWVSHQLCSYGITETNDILREFSTLIVKGTEEIERGVQLLATLKKPQEVKDRSTEINRLWNQSRELLSSAILDLFNTGDPVLIIKFKDIYENLEEVLARCNNVGHVLNDISMHHL